LIHFVSLDHRIIQRRAVTPLCHERLEFVPLRQQPLAIHAHLPGQLRRGHALHDAAQQLHDRHRVVLGALQDRAGQDVEAPPARLAAIVQDRPAVGLVDESFGQRMAVRTPQPLRVKNRHQQVVTALPVQQRSEREVHSGPP